MLRRQKQLLGLLLALGGRMRNLDFQKLLFLYSMEVEEPPSYQFVPYRYGGFSFTSYADRRKLVVAGYLDDDEQVWRLTQVGEAAVFEHSASRPEMAAFCRRTRLRGDRLVAETYRRHPYYATRSEIVDRLGLTASELRRIRASRPPRQEAGLLTIGYEGRSLEDYINALLRAGVTLLCDVRRNPLSRKYGFSKGVLSRTCENLSIRYEHVPQLGIASAQRRGLETKADYATLFRAYVQDTIPANVDILEQIRGWVLRGERVALTCYERDAQLCHRHCVTSALSRLDETLACVEHV